MFRNLLVILFLLNSLQCFASAYKLEGKVIDENNEGLPFATLYIENTTIGTTTNADGFFSLDLEEGAKRLIFQFVGYEKLTLEVKVGPEMSFLTVQLQPQTYQLQEIVVTANGEDPAYRVIRNAMDKRKYYENEVEAYSCDVYIKGIQSITQKPERFLGFKVTIDSGIVYLSESVSKLHYAQPDNIKEVMISSKVSGRNNAFSYNQASDMLFNPYQNLFKYENLSERGFVSPIANNALLFYDYKLVGTNLEDSLLINKIQVIAKRATDPVFNGYIYIVEDSWRIHSVEMLLTKSNQIEFVDSLWINQVYAPVSDSVWMLLSQKFDFKLKAFGFKGNGTFIGVHSNYELETKSSNSISSLFPDKKSFFNNELLAVQDGANERDSLYWETIRPVPLTDIEIKDYQEKDSIQVIKESKAYKDSVDRETNQPGLTNLFLTGYVHSRSYRERYLRFDPIIRILQYNTVEGPVANLAFTLTQREERRVQYQIIPNIRYGFSNNQLNISTKGFLYTNHHNFERLGLEVGKTVRQFNNQNPIKPEVNTFETLINRRNLIKLHSEWTGKFFYRREIANGLLLRSTIQYSQRKELNNSSAFSFFDEGERFFTSNSPSNQEDPSGYFPTHNALILDVAFRIRLRQTYMTRPDRKIILDSKLPEISIRYRQGLPMAGSDVNFSFLQIGIRDNVQMGLLGKGRYSVSADHFLNKRRLYLMDFKHFNGNRSFITEFSTTKFQLLDYYFYSTRRYSFESHYEHHFNGFIIDKIPLLKKTKIQVVGAIHSMYTPVGKTYMEYGVGLEHIFKIMRIDYYRSTIRGNNYSSGIRIGLGF
ncbi:MAG: DUF5686 and carboxypeptidase regulatory-like domain-containing protein [bacterium]|nr:DUF5686 and carboxypeptidase regulatory-like domain-containing protein [bacterium]